MIKITISDQIKNELEQSHWDDVFINWTTSLKQTLKVASNQTIIRKHPKLKAFLFNKDMTINTNNIKKLILGNKRQLELIIPQIGIVNEKTIHENIFCYENFAGRKYARVLLEKLNVRVCPYCNRQYTFTLNKSGTKPQFDHYFPKSLYPYLSLSLYNLIPSCSICNQAKSDFDTAAEPLLYPFDDEFGHDVKFETKLIENDFSHWMGIGENFNVTIEPLINKYKSANEKLHLTDLYNMHKDYIRDIIRNAIIYTDDKIEELLNQFPTLFASKYDVLNSIFMTYIDKDDWGKRPLAKLTHDIYEEFKIMKRN